MARLLCAVEGFRHGGNKFPRRIIGIFEVRRAGEDGEIRRIDGGGLHLDQHLVAGGVGKTGFRHLHGELAVSQRAENLFSGSGHDVFS